MYVVIDRPTVEVQPLIAEIPDEASLEAGVVRIAKVFPVFTQRASYISDIHMYTQQTISDKDCYYYLHKKYCKDSTGVSHGMCVFA